MCNDQAGLQPKKMVHAQELIWHMFAEVWCVRDTPQDFLIAKLMLQSLVGKPHTIHMSLSLVSRVLTLLRASLKPLCAKMQLERQSEMDSATMTYISDLANYRDPLGA